MYKNYIQFERACATQRMPVHEFGRRAPARNKIEHQDLSTVYCLPYTVYCPMSTVYLLPSTVYCSLGKGA